MTISCRRYLMYNIIIKYTRVFRRRLYRYIICWFSFTCSFLLTHSVSFSTYLICISFRDHSTRLSDNIIQCYICAIMLTLHEEYNFRFTPLIAPTFHSRDSITSITTASTYATISMYTELFYCVVLLIYVYYYTYTEWGVYAVIG